MAVAVGQGNLLVNGDFSQGYSGWSGFLNLVDAATTADDVFVGRALANLKLTAGGTAEFIGFYDAPSLGSYDYRLAPSRPHLSQTLDLQAGSYLLDFSLLISTSGMNINQQFEVLLDGKVISSDSLWVPQPGGGYGAAPDGVRSISLQISTPGSHTLAFGFNQAGFNVDTSPYVQYSNHVQLDAVSLTLQSLINTLEGTAGNDLLSGTAAADLLRGLDGADTLDGAAGADVLEGGAGDDVYLLRDAGDQVIEQAGAGTDLLLSHLAAATLAANVENGRIMLKTAADLTGNSLDNLLYAGQGNNVLDGAAGVDQVSYAHASRGVRVDLGSSQAQATGGSGSDTLIAIENLTGSAHADRLTGNLSANLLQGGAGNDKLAGGLGLDTLVGGSGRDQFIFDTAAGSGNVDVLQDFVSGSDQLLLDDDVFSALGRGTAAGSKLAAGSFVAGSVALDADDRILYDSQSGQLWYDADGSGAGAAVQIALLGAGCSLLAGDLCIIA